MSKGAYLISSAGWSYHHKDVKYDRKDNVVICLRYRVGPLVKGIAYKLKLFSINWKLILMIIWEQKWYLLRKEDYMTMYLRCLWNCLMKDSENWNLV